MITVTYTKQQINWYFKTMILGQLCLLFFYTKLIFFPSWSIAAICTSTFLYIFPNIGIKNTLKDAMLISTDSSSNEKNGIFS